MLLASPDRRAVADTTCGPMAASAPISTSLPIDRRGMNPGLDRRGGMEAAHGAREGRARLGRADHGAAARARIIRRHDQAARGGGFRLLARLAAAEEREIAAAGGFERSHAGQLLLAIAFEGGAQPFRQFAYAHVL